MQSNQMYYAAFSAALMAGTEPEVAQQLAYQLAYLVHSPITQIFGDVQGERPSTPTKEPEPIETPVRVKCPINPLSHVDWLHGGMLNERGIKLSHTNKHASPTYRQSSKIINPIDHQTMLEEDKSTRKLNRAILLAMTGADDMALSKFVVALFYYLKKHTTLEVTALPSSYWLMMHAIRCYLFGTSFHWQMDYAQSTDERQQKHPMYDIVKTLLDDVSEDNAPTLEIALLAHLRFYSPTQQLQCLRLGVTFRHDIMNQYDVTNYADQNWLHFPDLDRALSWLSKS